MAANRIDQYRAFLERDPGNSFARYVIAQEYMKLGDIATAVQEFEAIIAHDPDYVAAYYHGGKALERDDRVEDARSLYETGIQAAKRTGNDHTRAELEEAMAALPPPA